MQWPVGVIFMIHAPILIEIVFGSQWLPAVATLQILAASLLIQSLANVTGWLFISQARSKEMFYWSVFSSITTVAGFAAGLPYGIEGVAAGYVIVSFVRLPLLFYVVGRTGQVRTADLYSTLFIQLPAMALFTLINLLAAMFLTELHPILQFCAIALLGLCVIPCIISFKSNRTMLMEGIQMIRTRLKERKQKKLGNQAEPENS